MGPNRELIAQGLANSATGVENCVTAALRGSICGPLLELPAALGRLLKSKSIPERCVGSVVVGVCGV